MVGSISLCVSLCGGDSTRLLWLVLSEDGRRKIAGRAVGKESNGERCKLKVVCIGLTTPRNTSGIREVS